VHDEKLLKYENNQRPVDIEDINPALI